LAPECNRELEGGASLQPQMGMLSCFMPCNAKHEATDLMIKAREHYYAVSHLIMGHLSDHLTRSCYQGKVITLILEVPGVKTVSAHFFFFFSIKLSSFLQLTSATITEKTHVCSKTERRNLRRDIW
jgi:hypothetical protein